MTPHDIDNAKREYTDQLVQVVGERRELARFAGLVGRVKTVNMNGKALVEFQDYTNNIGWYDIDLGALEIVADPAAAPPEAEEPARHN